ncbi:jg25090, partial [Pararge aegeria aegeria]
SGLQNHPYLYSQYPIDFPNPTSHAYSVNGVSPQFASPELYSPTALGSHSQQHELIQQSDASAQQSQQAPTQLLVNSTRAAERWDGKSKLFKIFEPVVDKIRSFFDPIANVFYDAMPTFRGLSSDVSTSKSVEPEGDETKRQKEILIPQPRTIAQRKMSYRKTPRYRPKKYVELNLNLDRLKHNKDYIEYVKTKKYQYNYPQTFYYPRIKYFVNPNTFPPGSSNNRLLPYRKPVLRRNILVNTKNISETTTSNILSLETTDWRPIIVNNVTNPNLDQISKRIRKHRKKTGNVDKNRRKQIMKKRKRVKRSLDLYNIHSSSSKISNNIISNRAQTSSRGIFGFLEYLSNPFANVFKKINGYADKVVKQSLKSKAPPKYYTIVYSILMFYLDAIDGLVEVHEALKNYVIEDLKTKPKRKLKKKNKKKKKSQSKVQSNETISPE